MSHRKNVVKSLIASALLAIASGMFDAGVGPSIDQFLRWISMGSGAALIASVIVDTLLHLVPAWNAKATKTGRFASVLLLTVGLVFGANALLQQTHLNERIEPFYRIVFLVLLVRLTIEMRESNRKKI